MEGVDLATIAEEWKQNGINSISEHQLQKIEGDYLLQEELKLKALHLAQESITSKGILENIPLRGINLKGSREK